MEETLVGKEGDMLLYATFASVWDDGTYRVESPCTVDFDSMSIVEVLPANVIWDDGGCAVTEMDEMERIQGSLEHLDGEYVELPDGQRYTAVRADMMLDVDDVFGHGVVTYQ